MFQEATFWVLGFMFGWCFGFRVLGLVFHLLGFVFPVSGFGCCVFLVSRVTLSVSDRKTEISL